MNYHIASFAGHILAADSSVDAISILLTWGPGGVVLALILFGVLEPRRVRDMLLKEKDDWRSAFEKEQTAHQKTREALAAAELRAEISVDAARTTNQLLTEMQRRSVSRDGGN